MKFQTLKDQWENEYFSADQTETLQAFTARKARALFQHRRWKWLVVAVWERDKGICHVCGHDLNEQDCLYECGHVVDRCVDGKDELENLVVMCVLCNRQKPAHRTAEEYEAWRSAGGYLGRLDRAITAAWRGDSSDNIQ